MPSAATRIMTVYQTGSSTPRLMPVATTQTIKKGDLLIADTNGRITQAAAAGANVAAASITANHLFLADQDAASLAQDTLIQVLTVDEDTTLRMPLTTNGSPQAFAQAQVGKGYEIRRNADGNYFVDVSVSTAAKVQVIDRDPNTPAADAWGVVLVRPLADQWAK